MTATAHPPRPNGPLRIPQATQEPERQPEWPPAPTDPDEAAYHALRAMPELDRKIAGTDRHMSQLGVIEILPDENRYESHYGPGSLERDWSLIAEGNNRLIELVEAHLFDDNGPTVPLTEYQIIVTAGQLDPLYTAALAKLPPEPPKGHLLYRAWQGMAHEALRTEWKRAQGQATQTAPPPFISLGSTRDLDTSDEDYIIGDGLITRGGKLMLYGYAGSGKTTLLDHLAASLASGTPFLGVHQVDQPHRVLYVQGELTRSEIASHGQDLLAVFENTEADDNLVFWRNTQLPLPDAEDRLRQAILDTGATVIILDPFNRFFRGENSMTQEEVGQVFRMIDRLLEDPDLGLAAAIVSHHMNVSKARMAGTYDFEAWPSTILRLDTLATASTTRKITYEKIRAPGSPYTRQVKTIELTEHGYHFAANERPSEPHAGPLLIRDALEELGSEAFRRDLISRGMAKTNSKERAVIGYIGQAVQQKLIQRLPELASNRQAVFRLIDQPEVAEDAA
jgi:energy-coupling factor transporter ATP-binding protein EcfA2